MELKTGTQSFCVHEKYFSFIFTFFLHPSTHHKLFDMRAYPFKAYEWNEKKNDEQNEHDKYEELKDKNDLI